jgi:RNA polymerase sigma-70 factor (ECF subfamily)
MSVARPGEPDEESQTLELSFESFFAAAFDRLAGSMSLYASDRHEGEEIAQEAMARACRDWEAVRTTTSPDAWVHRVGLNLANSRFRRARVRRSREHMLRRPQIAVSRSDDALALMGALAKLAPRQRQAVVLRYYADLSVADAASAMKCAEGTVRALTAQAIAALRERLGELEVVDET